MAVPHDGPCAVEVGGLADWRGRYTLPCQVSGLSQVSHRAVEGGRVAT